MNRRYRITTAQDRATITDTLTRRTIEATRRPSGAVTFAGKLPAPVRRAAAHELNRSAY
jgi:hypothetical protein